MLGIPNAVIASLTIYSRKTGPNAARPSPRRENGVGSRTLELDITPDALSIDNLAEQNCTPIAQLRDKMAELVTGVRHGDRLSGIRHQSPCKHFESLRDRQANSGPAQGPAQVEY